VTKAKEQGATDRETVTRGCRAALEAHLNDEARALRSIVATTADQGVDLKFWQRHVDAAWSSFERLQLAQFYPANQRQPVADQGQLN
jgi:hypothetical protein